jgi:hypothetical protein
MFFPLWPVDFMVKSPGERPKAVKLVELVVADRAGWAELSSQYLRID